ncbi:hypothetical protein NPIL_582671 [Nephila pilipes]|uniref:Uncharacterized protein n=1 Tax=Nephila pilipes TaxID=299642 RepID=A0A8X6MV83_NEPPI|nr:hypothetical protein NPIL_582671 [Nephila pilipes]
MNRKMWKCCGNTFSDFTKYYAHVLINHTKNADYGRTIASNRNVRTTLDESKDGCSKQIRVTKNSTGMNKCKKDILVVDSISKSNDFDRTIEASTKNECKKNIPLVSMKTELKPSAQHNYGWLRTNNLVRLAITVS